MNPSEDVKQISNEKLAHLMEAELEFILQNYPDHWAHIAVFSEIARRLRGIDQMVEQIHIDLLHPEFGSIYDPGGIVEVERAKAVEEYKASLEPKVGDRVRVVRADHTTDSDHPLEGTLTAIDREGRRNYLSNIHPYEVAIDTGPMTGHPWYAIEVEKI